MRKKSLLYIGNKLSAKGATVTSIETLGRLLEQENYLVIRASSIKNKVLRLMDMLWSVLKYSRKAEIVLIDTYSTLNFYYAVTVANVCRLLRRPYIPILHGGNLPKRLQTNKYLCWKLFNGAKYNVAPSKYLLTVFEEAGYKNVVYIPNSIRLENYPFRSRTNFAPKLLWVRSFAEIYNPTLALDIIEKLKLDFPNAELTMVGPDKDGSLQRCKEIAALKNLPVRFTGKLSKKDWIDLASEHSVFINTTNFDNTPVSVIEAMALGLPVVTTNVGGIPYLIDDHKDGIMVPPEDVSAFVSAINTLINSPAKSEELVWNARKKVEEFDWKLVRKLWFKLLDE